MLSARTALQSPTLASDVLGRIDLAYAWYGWLSSRESHKFFSKGFGDLANLRAVRTWFEEGWKLANSRPHDPSIHPANKPVAVEWETPFDPALRPAAGPPTPHKAKTANPDVVVDDGVFTSPCAPFLPHNSPTQNVAVRLVRSRSVEARCVVLHMPATGHEGWETRQRLAESLLPYGIASVLIEAPFYGARRPHGQVKHLINNMSDYAIQTYAIVFEASAVLFLMRRLFPTAAVAVTGTSWGGAMAACAAVYSRLPVACIPCLGSESPDVMVNGVMNWQINWAALATELSHHAEWEDHPPHALVDVAKERVLAEFAGMRIGKTLEQVDDYQPTIPVFVQVSALSDHFVPTEAGALLFDTMQRTLVQGAHSEAVPVRGGHASSFVGWRNVFLPAIVKGCAVLLQRHPHNAPSP